MHTTCQADVNVIILSELKAPVRVASVHLIDSNVAAPILKLSRLVEDMSQSNVMEECFGKN